MQAQGQLTLQATDVDNRAGGQISATTTVSLLCDAGDWLLLPAGVPHVFDAGESPDVSFLRLTAGTRGWFPWHTGLSLPHSLPAKDAFVEHLLHELGEDIEGSGA